MKGYFKCILLLIVIINSYNSKSWSQSFNANNHIYRLTDMTDSFLNGNKETVLYHHSFTYDNQGRPITHVWDYKNNGKLISSNKMIYNYDEQNGRLLSKVSDNNRYHYFYDDNGNLQHITLEILIKGQWKLYEETKLEQNELPGNNRLVLLILNKRRTSGPRNDSIDNYSKIQYTIDASNSITQSQVISYSYRDFKTPKVYFYFYDNKPNPLQQIFIERFYEFDLENRGLTNLVAKKTGDKIMYQREYEYNEVGLPVKCIKDDRRTICFKYKEIKVAQQKPVEQLAFEDRSSVLLFPNPAKTEITIKAEGLGEGTANIRLYDINGRMYKEVRYEVFNTLEVLMPVGGLARGMYIVEIIAPKVTTRRKLIIQ